MSNDNSIQGKSRGRGRGKAPGADLSTVTVGQNGLSHITNGHQIADPLAASFGLLNIQNSMQPPGITPQTQFGAGIGMNGSVASGSAAAMGSQHYDTFRQLLECTSRRPPLLQHVSTDSPQSDSLRNQFRDLIFELTTNPAAFDTHVPYIIESLNMSEVSESVCDDLASTLVRWSIVEQNFRYTGSKLAHYLSLPEQLNFDFRTPFLRCVKTECYHRLEGLIQCVTSQEHAILEGIMLFMAELYLNMGLVKMDVTGNWISTRIEFLQKVLKDAVLKILEQANSDKPLATVGKILKLTGSAIDECDMNAERVDRDKTERIYMHLTGIIDDSITSEGVKTLYRRVLTLRENRWQSPERIKSQNNLADSSSDKFRYYDVPVFFLDDGTPIPAHEDVSSKDFVEGDPTRSERHFYLHGEGDASNANTDQSNDAGFSHTLTEEEERAFNDFLSQMKP